MNECKGLAVVVIGRNEGDRLVRCLRSLEADFDALIYVDSGSTDDSVARAIESGATVVELDSRTPFTAGRGRNAGIEALRDSVSQPSFVQFLDGDCELVPGWIDGARDTLARNSDAAIACGRRRERFPDASIFNLLCDLEWDTPIGEALACGGDFLVRWSAFHEVGGFNPAVIAGEEPEMCVRLRLAGWKILRIDHEMTMHDAAMTRWHQWWRRAHRAGHAFAELAWRHRHDAISIGVKPAASALAWSLAWPLLGICVGITWGGWLGFLLVASGYSIQLARVAYRSRSLGRPWRASLAYAAFIMLGKFAQLSGILRFAFNRLSGHESKIIEYKEPSR